MFRTFVDIGEVEILRTEWSYMLFLLLCLNSEVLESFKARFFKWCFNSDRCSVFRGFMRFKNSVQPSFHLLPVVAL